MSFGGTQGAIRYTLSIDDSNATQKLNQFKNNLKGLDQSTQSSATQLGKYNQQQAVLESRSSKLSAGLKTMGSNFGLIATSIGATVSSVVNLSRSYNDLSDTQIRVDQTALKVSRTQEAVTKAQDKVNEMVKDGDTFSQDYEQALTDLKQAQDAAAIATTNHGEALEDQQRAYEDFYINLIPTAITSVGLLGSTMQGLGINGSAALAKLSTAIQGLSLSLKTLTTAGVVGLAITGITLLITKIIELQEEKKKLDQTLKNTEDIAFKTIHNPAAQAEEYIKTAQALHDEFLRLKSDTQNPDLFHYSKYKIRNDMGIVEKGYATTIRLANSFHAEMAQGEQLISGYTSAYQNMANVIAQSSKPLAQQIAEIAAHATALQGSKDAMDLMNNVLDTSEAKVVEYTPKIEALREANIAAEAAWNAHVSAINSFSTSIQSLDKAGIKDFLKDLGFDKSGRKNVRIQIELDQKIKEQIEGLGSIGQLFLTKPIKEEDFDAAISNIIKGLEKSAKKNPEDKDLLKYFLAIDTDQAPGKVIEQLDAVFDTIRNDPKLSKMAAEKGITIPDLIVNSSPTTPVKVDVGKFIEFDSSGPAAKPINMDIFAQNLNDAVKAAEVTAPKITKALQTKFPPIEMSDFSQNLNDSIKAATQTTKKIEKGLKVKFPAIDMDTYAGNLNDAVTAADDTRKKIEKALSSDIKINVGFDVDKPPKITESGGKIDVEFAASGYQGWVRGGQGQMFMVAEHGEDEYVSITPRSKIRSQNGVSGGNMSSGPIQITLNINGNDIIESRKIVKLIRDVTGRNTSRHT